jgi:hypothetical protein
MPPRIVIGHAQLASCLKQSGLKVWDRSVQTLPGDNWALKTGEALEASDALVVLLSPGVGKSETIVRTVQYALGSERFQNRLIPVMVRPTTKFPWILKDLQVERGNPTEVGKHIVERLRKTGSQQLHS